MHETDDHKRWLDLLDDLGLPPESHPTPPPVPKAAPVAEVVAPALAEVVPVPAEVAPVAEVAPEEAPAPRTRRKKAAAPEGEGEGEKEPASRPRRKRRVAKAEEVAEEAPALAEEPTLVAVEHVVIEIPAEVSAPVVVVTPTMLEMLEEVELEGGEPADAEPSAEPNGEDPAKRRRRRRRRRKPSDAVEGSAVQPAIAGRVLAEEALEDAEEEESAPAFAKEIVSDEEDEEPSETPPALEEDMEFEDLSNLDMPSWSELVGSLYRPADR